MKLLMDDDFDIGKIANSGQSFRLNQIDENKFRIVACNKVLYIIQTPNAKEVIFDCPEDEFYSCWYEYFDLDTHYKDIRALVPPEDQYLSKAIQFGQGIRILRQDPWEMLITFIISQRKNIPAIKKAVEQLSMLAGSIIGEYDHQKVYAFPTPSQIASLSNKELQSCGLGYRTKYVQNAAQKISTGELNFDELKGISDTKLFKELKELYGVGTKVANCVMLFGFHRLNSFPRDVWINRVIDNKYNGKLDFELYEPYQGIIQQYLFHYVRYE